MKFWLARLFGKSHETSDVSDGLRRTYTGYVWRGVFYVWKYRTKIVDGPAFKSAVFSEDS